MTESNRVDSAKSELYKKYKKKIDELYEFRDKYYINNPKSKYADRNRDLNEKLNELINELDGVRDQFDSLSTYWVLLGKAHDVVPEYSAKAFDALTKAVKQDAKCYEGWNYLGECYWKKREFGESRNCFLRSLNIQKNKLSLRGLSMVTKHLAKMPRSNDKPSNEAQAASAQVTPKLEQSDPKTLIEDSVKYAKDALQLDLKDGMSWYILANSYLAQFFSPLGQNNPGLLKQAISAYNLALKDESIASTQSDLYFNKSMTSLYEENWSDVLFCLTKALQLDPNWTEAKDSLKGVLEYLSQIQEMIGKHGKLKAKKFQSLIESIKDSDAGPYLSKDANSSEQNKPKKFDLKESTLKELKKGLNENSVLIGKVISGMPVKSTDTFNMICFTCCIADKNGDCAALTIYNLVVGEGVIIGDSIAIPEPWLEKTELTYNVSEVLIENENEQKEHSFKFDSIRVENPSVLVVNGKKWTKEKVSSAVFVPKVLDD